MAENMYFRAETDNMQTELDSQMLVIKDTSQQGSATCWISSWTDMLTANIRAVVRNLPATGIISLIDASFTYRDELRDAGTFHLDYDCSTKEFVTEFNKQTTSGTETTTNRYSFIEIEQNRAFSIILDFGDAGGTFNINMGEDKPLAYSFDSPIYISSIQLRSNLQSENLAYRLYSTFEFNNIATEAHVSFTLAEMFPPVMSGSTNAKFTAASEPDLRYLTVIPSAEAQTFTPTDGADGFYRVDVFAANSDIDPNIQPDNIKQGVTILGMPGRLVEFKPTQKAITIGTNATFPVKYYPEGSANGFSEFAINGITNLEASNIKKGVTIAGVAGSLEEKKLRTKYADIPSYYPLPYTINPDSNFNGMDKVIINTIGNLSAGNIKQGVTIAGVQGTVVEKNGQAKTTSLAPDDSLPYVVEPDSPYNAIDSLTITGITNLTADNIKKDVQIAGITGTYEGSASSDLITVTATNHKTSAVQAGQKVLVHKGVVSGVASYTLYDATNIDAPDYLKNYTFGVAVNAIPLNQGGSVKIPADMGTAIGKYVLNTAGQGHAYFNSWNTNDADYGSNYLGYAAINSDGYAQIDLPNVPYTDINSTLIEFAFKRIGSATEAKHLVAKVCNSWDTEKIKVADEADVFRIYLTCGPSGYELEIQYKKTDGTFAT